MINITMREMQLRYLTLKIRLTEQLMSHIKRNTSLTLIIYLINWRRMELAMVILLIMIQMEVQKKRKEEIPNLESTDTMRN